MDSREAQSRRTRTALVWLGERTASLGLWVGATTLLIIVALNGLNIVLRYFFFAALSWAEEAMLYLMIFGVYAAAISVAWQHAHIRIDAFLNMAPPRHRRLLNIASTLLMTAILIPVLLASYHVVSLLFDFDQRSDALHVPMWIPQGIVPAAMFLIIVMSLLRIFVHPAASDGDPQNMHGAG